MYDSGFFWDGAVLKLDGSAPEPIEAAAAGDTVVGVDEQDVVAGPTANCFAAGVAGDQSLPLPP